MRLASVPRAVALFAVLGVAACGSTAQVESLDAPGTQPAKEESRLSLAADELAAVAENKIVVHFPEGSAALTPEANSRLDVAARLFRDASPVVMFTTGYADSTGSEFPNLILSAHRAAAIKTALIRRGVPERQLLIRAHGASEPMNDEAPTSRENRRVEITWRLV